MSVYSKMVHGAALLANLPSTLILFEGCEGDVGRCHSFQESCGARVADRCGGVFAPRGRHIVQPPSRRGLLLSDLKLMLGVAC